MVRSCEEQPDWFPKWLQRLRAQQQGPRASSAPWPTLAADPLFDDSAGRCEAGSHCGSICISLMMLSSFSWAAQPLAYFLWRTVYSDPFPFLNWVVCIVITNCSCLHILNTSLLQDCWFAKVLFHSVGCVFTPLSTKAFKFDDVEFVIFSFVAKKPLHNINSGRFIYTLIFS